MKIKIEIQTQIQIQIHAQIQKQIHKYRYNSDTNTDKNAMQMKRIGAAGQRDEDSGLKETRALPFSPLHWLCTGLQRAGSRQRRDRGEKIGRFFLQASELNTRLECEQRA